MAVEQSTLRSLDSECAGRVIEPRNSVLVGADAVNLAEGNTSWRYSTSQTAGLHQRQACGRQFTFSQVADVSHWKMKKQLALLQIV